MIGIDIIDLQDPLLKNRTGSDRFILHPEDRIVRDFWDYWTAKEAIFKCQRKPGPFKPKDIPINFVSDNYFHSEGWKGAVISTENYCLSMAGAATDHFIFTKETPNPSAEIRSKISKWFLEEHQIKTAIVPDANGLPSLSHNKSPVSITHHGRFMAFAFMLN